jgi:ribosomal-protein-alanine N-acetyltransferase
VTADERIPASVDDPMIPASVDDPMIPASVDDPIRLASVDDRIRPASIEDHDAIVALPGLSGSTRRTLAAALIADDHRCVVAEAPGPDGTAIVVGAALGVLLVDEAHVVDVAVATPHRRRGIGAALVSRLDADLRARGATATTLEVRPSNTAALALYARLGFVAEGRRPRYYPDGEDAVLCWRREVAS